LSGCVFCGIVAGVQRASVVVTDERTIAFMDIRPVNSGHTLVVPKRHADDLAQLDRDDGAAMFSTAQQVAAAQRRSGLRCEGVNLFLADGKVAGQEVFHVHLHVVPRFAGDGFGLRIEGDYRVRERAELEEAAAQLRAAL
jgi:histidine triad (HIT) family protein